MSAHVATVTWLNLFSTKGDIGKEWHRHELAYINRDTPIIYNGQRCFARRSQQSPSAVLYGVQFTPQ